MPKKNGNGLRIVQDFIEFIVQDFIEFNAHSHIDNYSIKEINEFISEICGAGSTIFTTLNLASGFWQMPLHPNDAHLNAFTVHS